MMDSFNYICYGTTDLSRLKGMEKERTGINSRILRAVCVLTMGVLAALSIASFLSRDEYSFTLQQSNVHIYFPCFCITLLNFILLVVLKKKENYKRLVVQMYVELAVIYVMLINLGTYRAPDANAVTLFVVLVVIPVLFSDVPYRMNSFSLFVMVSFLLSSAHVKAETYFRADLINGIVALMISIVFCIVTQNIRITDYHNKRRLSERGHRDSFVSEMLHKMSFTSEAEDMIPQGLAYIADSLRCEGALLFEKNEKRDTYDKSYTYFKKDAKVDIEGLKKLPYDGVLDYWFYDFSHKKDVVIDNIEEYRLISPSVYQWLKPLKVETMVAGPLVVGSEYMGFYVLVNPPLDDITDLDASLNFIEFVLDMLVRFRNDVIQIENSGHVDAMTGLYNRQYLTDVVIKNGIEEPFALVMTDILGLKAMNETYGQEAGDRLIIRGAAAMKEVFGKENVFRIGGDEFLAVVKSQAQDDVEQMKLQLREKLKANEVTMCIGSIYKTPPMGDFDELLKEADHAMIEDKRKYYENSALDRRQRDKKWR